MKERFKAGALCAWGLWLLASTAMALPAADRFAGVFWSQVAELKELPLEVKIRAAGFDYVLIGGFGGDYKKFLRRPFADMVLELQAQGISPGQIHLLQPSSSSGVEENAMGFVSESLSAIAARTTRPLVVLTHSKAGPEFLAFALNEPEFVEQRVDSVFFVQGAFGGSHLANYMAGERPQGGAPPRTARMTLSTVRWLLTRVPSAFAGMYSLRTDVSRQRIERWLTEKRQAMERVASRVVFVRGKAERAQICFHLRAGADFLRAFGAECSDGTVPFENQIVSGFPAPEVILEGVDHSLPCPDIVTGQGVRRARALARALMSSVGR